MRLNNKAISLMVLLAAHFFITLPAFAEESIFISSDCTEIEVRADVDPELSDEENLQRLSEIFYESLNTVTHCQSVNHPVSGAQPSNEGSMGDVPDSVAASDLSGTESDEALSQNADDYVSEMDASEMDVAEIDENDAVLEAAGTKAPDDIPPADNDSILEKQMRELAENETDPEVKARLWNEYRKYKGLPVKPVKEKL